ncbi:MAG: hypothetical protein HY360_03020 [Verrucomicrobia bacterium]|nr:hypothetical protein [Verrucomicrobiota bacterium]
MKRPRIWLQVAMFFAVMNQLQADRMHAISLSPGDGAILLLGTQGELEAVTRDYFLGGDGKKDQRTKDDPYRFESMPFGFYLGDHTAVGYREQAARMGLDIWDWHGRLLGILKSGGANTIIVQGGGYLEKEGEFPAKTFAEFAAARGFKVIIQPNDAYFGGSLYSSWKAGMEKAGSNPSDTGLDAFFRRYLKPRLEQHLAAYGENAQVFAWSPVEELGPDQEKFFTPYKKLLHDLTPGQLHYQYDNNLETLKTKEPPYPDIFGFGGYCWWHGVWGDNYCLWTPHYSARWLYGRIQPYPERVHKLFKGQAICVLQGPAWFTLIGPEDGAKHGWKPESSYVCPTAPGVRWYEKLKLYGVYNMHLPPANAERLSCWLAVCAGFKGTLIWAGVCNRPEDLTRLLEDENSKAGDNIMMGIIHTDLTTTSQWEELAGAWKQMRKLERLILALEPSSTPYAASDDPNMFVNSFQDREGRRFIVVVNGLIGQWDKDSPDWLNYPRTKLSIGMDGNLIHYRPLREARSCALKLSEDGQVFDMRTVSPKKYPAARR